MGNQEIINRVCQKFGLSFEEMNKRSRDPRLVLARQTTMYLIKSINKETWQKTADAFGMHHSNAIHAVACIEDLMLSSKRFVMIIDELKNGSQIVPLYGPCAIRSYNSLRPARIMA